MGGNELQKSSGTRPWKPLVLVVDDDPLVASAIGRLVQPTARTVTVASKAEALGALAMPVQLAGAVVDIGLPDGSGVDVVRHIREHVGDLPVMAVTGQHDGHSINALHALQAEYVAKPEFTRNLLDFVTRLAEQKVSRQGSRFARLIRLADEASLHPGEVEVLRACIDGVPRAHLADHLRLSENTIKSRVRGILAKTRARSLAAVQYRLLPTQQVARA